MVKDEIKDLLVSFMSVAIVGGLLAFVLSLILTPLGSMVGVWSEALMLLVILLVYFVILAKFKSQLVKLKWVNVTYTLVGAAFVGVILTLLVPSLSPFILSTNLTLTGIAWTPIYVLLASLGVKKLGI